MNLIGIGAVMFMTLIVVLGDYSIKLAVKAGGIFNLHFLLGFLLYCSSTFVWFFVLKYLKFAEANLIYSLFIILASIVIGVFVFGDHISPIEWVGIGLAITSIGLLYRYF